MMTDYFSRPGAEAAESGHYCQLTNRPQAQLKEKWMRSTPPKAQAKRLAHET